MPAAGAVAVALALAGSEAALVEEGRRPDSGGLLAQRAGLANLRKRGTRPLGCRA